MENVENKILEVLEDVGEKMAPVIKVIKVLNDAGILGIPEDAGAGERRAEKVSEPILPEDI